MFSKLFWKDAFERAIKTAAQGVLLVSGFSDAGPANLFTLDYKVALGAALGGAVLSVLTSIVSAPVKGTISPASFIGE